MTFHYIWMSATFALMLKVSMNFAHQQIQAKLNLNQIIIPSLQVIYIQSLITFSQKAVTFKSLEFI